MHSHSFRLPALVVAHVPETPTEIVLAQLRMLQVFVLAPTTSYGTKASSTFNGTAGKWAWNAYVLLVERG